MRNKQTVCIVFFHYLSGDYKLPWVAKCTPIINKVLYVVSFCTVQTVSVVTKEMTRLLLYLLKQGISLVVILYCGKDVHGLFLLLG